MLGTLLARSAYRKPEACDEEEVHRQIAKIRKLSTEFIGSLQDSSPVMIEVSK